jgi:hypothetical protein
MKEIRFSITDPGESGAGLRGFTDSVTIIVESGDPGGDDGEFEQFIKDALREWYQGATVEPEQDKDPGQGNHIIHDQA